MGLRSHKLKWFAAVVAIVLAAMAVGGVVLKLAAEGAIACLSASFFYSVNANRAPQLKRSLMLSNV